MPPQHQNPPRGVFRAVCRWAALIAAFLQTLARISTRLKLQDYPARTQARFPRGFARAADRPHDFEPIHPPGEV